MTAQRLREAAEKLREVATHATPSPWEARVVHEWADHDDDEMLVHAVGFDDPITPGGGEFADYGLTSPDALYIATMQPSVALVTAKLLDGIAATGCFPPDPHEAGEQCSECDVERAALAVADAILGEAS